MRDETEGQKKELHVRLQIVQLYEIAAKLCVATSMLCENVIKQLDLVLLDLHLQSRQVEGEAVYVRVKCII